jgi:hypothetical protein
MSAKRLIIKHAILITGMIGAFFLLSSLVGLEGNPYLRFLNLGFVLIGIRQVIKTNIEKNKETNYLENLGLGLQTSAVAVVFSIIGVIAFISFINPDFISIMNNSFLIGGNLSLAEVVITLVIEGMASSFVGSFIVMQFYKNHDKVLATA